MHKPPARNATSSRRTPNAQAVTGRGESHLCTAADAERLGARVHRAAVEPFTRLQAEARKEGFDLRIHSGFRSFDRQLSIWNRKATGQLDVLDSSARPIDIGTLDGQELVFAILRWSALPGASRHHWGTDLDVYDHAAIPDGYEIQLIPDEVNPGGMFGPFHEWLDERITTATAFGFFRPYDRDRGGVAPERWHLSYRPVADDFMEQLTVPVLRMALQDANLELATEVIDNLDGLYERFVTNVNRFAQ